MNRFSRRLTQMSISNTDKQGKDGSLLDRCESSCATKIEGFVQRHTSRVLKRTVLLAKETSRLNELSVFICVHPWFIVFICLHLLQRFPNAT
jgi:hypothetical protein